MASSFGCKFLLPFGNEVFVLRRENLRQRSLDFPFQMPKCNALPVVRLEECERVVGELIARSFPLFIAMSKKFKQNQESSLGHGNCYLFSQAVPNFAHGFTSS